jgi:hypothetical protein
MVPDRLAVVFYIHPPERAYNCRRLQKLLDETSVAGQQTSADSYGDRHATGAAMEKFQAGVSDEESGRLAISTFSLALLVYRQASRPAVLDRKEWYGRRPPHDNQYRHVVAPPS